jgi:hypothetical protein
VRAPFAVWSLGIHLQWGLDIVQGRDVPTGDRDRVDEAATWCERTCSEYGAEAVLAVVTHGVFRRALAHRLLTSGWRLSGLRRHVPWSTWTLARSFAASRPLADER